MARVWLYEYGSPGDVHSLVCLGSPLQCAPSHPTRMVCTATVLYLYRSLLPSSVAPLQAPSGRRTEYCGPDPRHPHLRGTPFRWSVKPVGSIKGNRLKRSRSASPVTSALPARAQNKNMPGAFHDDVNYVCVTGAFIEVGIPAMHSTGDVRRPRV